MKTIFLCVFCLLAPNLTLAASPVTETYTLKNGGLKFAPTFQQNLQTIAQTDSRVQLIPIAAPKGAAAHVPYAVLCADIEVSHDRFQKLTTVAVSAQSKIPSAGLQSGYGGVTSIGSDRLTVTADFPNPDTASQDRYAWQAAVNVTSIDPNTKSNQDMSMSFSKNGAQAGGEQKSRSTLQIGKFHSVSVVGVLKTKEDRMEGPSINIAPRIAVWADSAFTNHELAEGEYDPDHDGLGSTFLSSELVFEKGVVLPAAPKVAAHKVSVCWSPNNYSTVTGEAAELIRPEVQLQFEQ